MKGAGRGNQNEEILKFVPLNYKNHQLRTTIRTIDQGFPFENFGGGDKIPPVGGTRFPPLGQVGGGGEIYADF